MQCTVVGAVLNVSMNPLGILNPVKAWLSRGNKTHPLICLPQGAMLQASHERCKYNVPGAQKRKLLLLIGAKVKITRLG